MLAIPPPPPPLPLPPPALRLDFSFNSPKRFDIELDFSAFEFKARGFFSPVGAALEGPKIEARLIIDRVGASFVVESAPSPPVLSVFSANDSNDFEIKSLGDNSASSLCETSSDSRNSASGS